MFDSVEDASCFETTPSASEFSIVVVGAIGVGKSALTTQFIQNIFLDTYDTTVEDSYRKCIRIDDETCLLRILDTAGQAEYKAFTSVYLRQGDGFLLVYDITDRSSFTQLLEIIQQLLREKDGQRSIPMTIASNKCDLTGNMIVLREEGEALAKKYNAGFFETSAKLRTNVDESFYDLVRAIQQQRAEWLTQERKQRKHKKCTIM